MTLSNVGKIMELVAHPYISSRNKWYNYFGKRISSSKAKSMPTLWSNNFSPRCIPKRSECLCPPTEVYKDVQNSAIHNCQKLETLQCQRTVGRINCDLSTQWNTKYRYELLLYETTWINCTDIMQESMVCMIPRIRFAKLISADRGWNVDYLGRQGGRDNGYWL